MKQCRNLVKHFVWGMLISLFLVSVVCASAYMEPYHYGGGLYEPKNYGFSIGVDDTKGIDFHGGITAMAIGMQFSWYGMSVMGTTQSHEQAGMIMTSGTIGAEIYNDASNIRTLFADVDNYFLYINGHGHEDPNMIRVHYGDGGSVQHVITDHELKTYLSSIPSDVNKWVVIDSCYSGGFIDELKELENISILTSASSTSKSAYDFDGIPYFSRELEAFFIAQNGEGFSFDDMVDHMKDGEWFKKYEGLTAYELGDGDPIILSEEYFNIQTYQSPSYNESVPEPAAIILLGFGLIGVLGIRRGIQK